MTKRNEKNGTRARAASSEGNRPCLSLSSFARRVGTGAACAGLAFSPLAAQAETGEVPLDEAPDGAGDSAESRTWSVAAGVTSPLNSPGAHLGVEYQLARAGGFDSHALLALEYYDLPIEKAASAQLRWGQRYTASFGLTLEAQVGLGVQRTVYYSTVFDFDGPVGVPREVGEALISVRPLVAFGPGFDFSRVLDVPLHVYARHSVSAIYPAKYDDERILVAEELGLRWTL